MGRTPRRACRVRGCGRTTASGYCEQHAAEREARARAARRRGPRVYDTARWRELRRAVLAERPLCEDGCGARSREVDHRVRVALRPELAFDRANLVALCKRCHSRKTAREVGWRGGGRSP